MAARGTSKQRSIEHETFVANTYDGKRSKSSGAAAHDQGDVRSADYLIECKYSGTTNKTFEKITKEAFSEGRQPMLALRYYDPKSPHANLEGYVDLSVRTVCDDIERVEDAKRQGYDEGMEDGEETYAAYN